MKTIDLGETLQWLEFYRMTYRRPSEGLDGHVFAPESNIGRAFRIPVVARSVLFLAQELSGWLPKPETLLWITHWTTHPPEEYQYFNEWLHQNNEHRKLIDAPSFLFHFSDRNDRWKLSQALFLLMALNWQGFVVQPAGKNFIWLADEIVEISTQDPMAGEHILSRMNVLGIEESPRSSAN